MGILLIIKDLIMLQFDLNDPPLMKAELRPPRPGPAVVGQHHGLRPAKGGRQRSVPTGRFNRIVSDLYYMSTEHAKTKAQFAVRYSICSTWVRFFDLSISE